MTQAPEVSRDPVVTPVRVVIGLCLFAPFVAMLWVGSYAKTDPAFIGIPFFYWYQMLWVLLSTVLTVLAHQLWRRDQRARATGHSPARDSAPAASGGTSADSGSADSDSGSADSAKGGASE